jgi:FG-GAP-like repeat
MTLKWSIRERRRPSRRVARPNPIRPGRFDALESRRLLTLQFSSLAGFGATATLVPSAVALDSAGDTIVTGSYSGTTSLDPSGAGKSNGFTDIYVAKFSPVGTPLWFRHYGNASADGSGSSAGQGLGLDAAGNVYVTGYYSGRIDFNPSDLSGKDSVSTFGGINAFVLKLDANGNFGASSYAIGTTGVSGAVNEGNGLAVDAGGTVTVTGQYEQALGLGGSTLTAVAGQEAFVARLTPTGSVGYLRGFTGTANVTTNAGRAVALDAAGDAYIAGTFRSSVAFGANAILTSASDSKGVATNDAFVAKLSPTGTTLYAHGYGGVAQDDATGIAASPDGFVDVIGRFAGTFSFNGPTITATSQSDIFVARLGPDGQTAFADSFGVLNSVVSSDKPSIVLDPALGTGYFTTSFQGSATVGGTSLVAASDDILIGRVSQAGVIGPVLTAGGTGSDAPTGLARNAIGQIAVAGLASSPASFGGAILPSNGVVNSFVAQIVDSDATGGGGGGGGGTKPTPGDFYGDHHTDLAVFDPTTATFSIKDLATGATQTQQFGIPNGKGLPVAGNFSGTSKTDFAFFDPTTATYYIRYANPAYNGGSRVQQFGVPNGKGFMVPGDFDGDGKTDEAVFDPVTATYYIRYSNPSFNGGSRIQQFGVPNGQNTMIPGDFDGDGKTDEAVFDPVTATYYIRYSNPSFNGGSRIQQFGVPNGKNQFVAGDYDGDGKTDETVFDPVTATYYIRYSNPSFNGGSKIQQFGVPNGKDVMVSGDFDGDGKTDIAVYDPPSATFYIQYSSGGSLITQFGPNNGHEIPIPAVVTPSSQVGALSVTGGSASASPDFVALPSGTEAADQTPAPQHKRSAHDAAIHFFGQGH